MRKPDSGFRKHSTVRPQSGQRLSLQSTVACNKRACGFEITNQAESFFYIMKSFFLTFHFFAIIFTCAWGCPGFDGIAKSCTASRTESSLNWQTNNCNFRKKRRRSWWGFFRSRSTRCVSSRAGTQVALFRVAWSSFTLSGLAAHCVWSLRGTFNQNTEATLVMLLPAPDNHLA